MITNGTSTKSRHSFMLTYILKRCAGAIPTLLILITISFFLMRLAPGGPFAEDRNVLPEIKANLDRVYHLDEPVWKQYFRYLHQLTHGDLGPSFKYPDWTVNQLIKQGFPVSLRLGALAMLLALLLGISLGCITAIWKNTWIDKVGSSFAMMGISIPNFVIAPILIFIFGLTLSWLPVAGWHHGNLWHLILPVISLALPQTAIITRMMRSSVIEVWGTNYIRTARAKGLPVKTMILRHALRPALLPVISYLGPALANIITGSIVIESIYALPGIGTFLIQGALNRDYTTVMGIVILLCALMLLFNLIVDLLYQYLDPKISY